MAMASSIEVLQQSPTSTSASNAPSPAVAVPALATPYFRLKLWIDRALALLLLIPGLPLIALLVLLVRLGSKGPGIYRQLRVGHRGKVFTLYKIRSMRSDAEASLGPTWAGIQGDSRVTALGFWLRKLHLDELPQLFNVLRGDMSLVGPRPERPEFVRVLAEKIPGYLDRLRVPPGITGLAQLNLPPDTDVESVRRKLMLDAEYLDNAGMGLDTRILLSTLARVLGLRGGKAVSLLGLQRNVDLPTDSSLRPEADAGAGLGPRSLTAVLLSNVCEGILSVDRPCI